MAQNSLMTDNKKKILELKNSIVFEGIDITDNGLDFNRIGESGYTSAINRKTA